MGGSLVACEGSRYRCSWRGGQFWTVMACHGPPLCLFLSRFEVWKMVQQCATIAQHIVPCFGYVWWCFCLFWVYWKHVKNSNCWKANDSDEKQTLMKCSSQELVFKCTSPLIRSADRMLIIKKNLTNWRHSVKTGNGFNRPLICCVACIDHIANGMIFVEEKVGESNTGQVKSYPNLMTDGMTGWPDRIFIYPSCSMYGIFTSSYYKFN